MDNPVNTLKPHLGKVKGLPKWAYIAAVGVGGAAIWYGINRSRSNAEATASDVTGDTGGTLSATTAGDAFPSGSEGAGYYTDPTSGTTSEDNLDSFFNNLASLQALGVFPTGGGTQPSASADDHYTPPSIVVNVPAAPVQTAPAKAASDAAGSKKDPCTGEFPYLEANTKSGHVGKCYKIGQTGHGRFHIYKGGGQWQAD